MSSKSRAIEEAGRLRGRVTKEALRAQQAERQQQAIDLAASEADVREVLELTRDLPTRSDGVILGPDGRPMLRPVVKDFSQLHHEGPDPTRLYAEDILKRAARMLRDGATLKHIAEALAIETIVPLSMLEAAILRVGMPLLERDIAAGVEPEETKVVVGYEATGEDDG